MLSVGPFDGFFERPGRRWRVENSETWVQLAARQKPRSGRCIEMYREKCDHVIFDLLRIWNNLWQRSPRKGLMSAVGWPWCIQAVGNWTAPLPKKLSEPRRFNLSQDTDDIYFQIFKGFWKPDKSQKTSSTYDIQLIHIIISIPHDVSICNPYLVSLERWTESGWWLWGTMQQHPADCNGDPMTAKPSTRSCEAPPSFFVVSCELFCQHHGPFRSFTCKSTSLSSGGSPLWRCGAWTRFGSKVYMYIMYTCVHRFQARMQHQSLWGET